MATYNEGLYLVNGEVVTIGPGQSLSTTTSTVQQFDTVTELVAQCEADEIEHGIDVDDEGGKTTEARAKRDQLISKVDYLAYPDYPLTTEQRDEVNAYRQALRDVPAQAGFPFLISWPVKPNV